jgi:hypothetical protein
LTGGKRLRFDKTKGVGLENWGGVGDFRHDYSYFNVSFGQLSHWFQLKWRFMI